MRPSTTLAAAAASAGRLVRLAVLSVTLGGPASALACDAAEKQRLSDEQERLATRNAWAGVERSYEALLATKCELGFEQHFLGGESAKLLGKVYEQHQRLTTALAMASDTAADETRSKAAIEASIADLEANYRRVEILGDPRRRPVLERPEMPFATDQRKAVEWAITVVSETGSFKGMLPHGKYVVGGVEFEAVPGADWQVVTVGKVKVPRPDPNATDGALAGAGTTQNQSFLRYGNVVATVGPAYLTSAEPGKAHLLPGSDIQQFSPANVGLSGFAVSVGGEVGLTYAEPALGLAAMVGYQGGFGTASFNLLNGSVQAVMRPGQARFALGPQYQVTYGSGTGLASWFNIRQLGATRDQLGYQGVSWGGGLQASAGYGVLDFDTLRGLVELGGSWQTDLQRSFWTVGLRFGIAPAVPRFGG